MQLWNRSHSVADLRIDIDRMMNDFEELSKIGSTGDGGVHRPALSKSHLEARSWLRGTIEESGLELHVDAAGNHSGILRSANLDAATLLIGSHLDSVPNGGRFDGALGVLTGLEVLRTMKEAKIDVGVHLEVIDFTDEEGTLVGLMGSRAVAGILPESDLEHPRGGRKALDEAFRRAGITDPLSASRNPEDLAGYLEIHIEQGPRLIEANADIGIVTALVGIVSYQLAFRGRADHAGTTPMNARLDAGSAAADYMVAARRLAVEKFRRSVLNFGQCEFFPGAYNIVPDRANVALEFRSPEKEELDRLELALLEALALICDAHGLSHVHRRQSCVEPATCAPVARKALKESANGLGLTTMELVSGAGHDAQSMCAVCPSGMIFIPSTGGSHNPMEFATREACENGANTVLHAVMAGWGRSGKDFRQTA